ncbi:MAG: YtxH domain-containing protein [Candidatus Margulisbacteria bacterium]|nr:YtxH domain-containing protein [Candidatus Margulisiibacteriota bacterium]
MENKGSGLLDGLLLGGLIGAALGILFAPKTGEEMRASLQARLKEYGLGDLVESLSEAFEAGKDEAAKFMEEEDL